MVNQIISVYAPDDVRYEPCPEVTLHTQGPLVIEVQKGQTVHLEVNMHYPLDVTYQVQSLASLTVVETRQFKEAKSLNHAVVLAEGAKMKVAYINDSNFTETMEIQDECHLGRDSEMIASYLEMDTTCMNAHYTYHLNGQGASAKVHLAAISSDGMKKAYQVSLNHHEKNTYGTMENYGVTNNGATLTFDGIGRIDKGMHQSESHQTSRIIVFDEQCHAKCNPYLYIDDFDVKASHAASVGAINEDHLYYLQSRGLSKKQAMHLITMGYLLPAIDVIEDEQIKQALLEALNRKVDA